MISQIKCAKLRASHSYQSRIEIHVFRCFTFKLQKINIQSTLKYKHEPLPLNYSSKQKISHKPNHMADEIEINEPVHWFSSFTFELSKRTEPRDVSIER